MRAKNLFIGGFLCLFSLGYSFSYAKNSEKDLEAARQLVIQKTNPPNLNQQEKPLNQSFPKKIDLETAITLALQNNPSLKQALQEVLISGNNIQQVGYIENPEISANFPIGEKDNSTQVFPGVSASQNVLDIYLAKLRKRAANSQLEVTKLQTAASAYELVTQVKKSFYTLQAIEQFRRQLSSIVQTTKVAAELSARQLQAGNITELELNTQKLIVEQAEIELVKSEAELRSARAKLAELLGQPELASKISVEKNLPTLPKKEMALDALEEMALSNRLDLAALKQKTGVFTQEYKLAKWQAFPSFRFGVEYERDPDVGTLVGPSIGFQVPIFNRGQAKKQLAQIQMTQNQYAILALENGIRTEVKEANSRLIESRELAFRYQQKIIPLLGNNLKETQLQYNFMLKGVYDLLQIRREQINAQRQYVEAIRDYWIEWASLERALGTRINLENIGKMKKSSQSSESKPSSQTDAREEKKS